MYKWLQHHMLPTVIGHNWLAWLGCTGGRDSSLKTETAVYRHKPHFILYSRVIRLTVDCRWWEKPFEQHSKRQTVQRMEGQQKNTHDDVLLR